MLYHKMIKNYACIVYFGKKEGVKMIIPQIGQKKDHKENLWSCNGINKFWFYSTVTDFAKLRGWSTLQFRITAI